MVPRGPLLGDPVLDVARAAVQDEADGVAHFDLVEHAVHPEIADGGRRGRKGVALRQTKFRW